MKKYRVSLYFEQEIEAEDEEMARSEFNEIIGSTYLNPDVEEL